jgi:hypothetical protein
MILQKNVRTIRIEQDVARKRLDSLRLAIDTSMEKNDANAEYGRITDDNIRYSLYAERLKSDLMAALTIMQQNINGAMAGYTTHSVLNNTALQTLSDKRHHLFNQRLTSDRSKLITTAYFMEPHIIFTTRIPIIRDENDYTLYNVVGIPSASKGETHQPRMNYHYYAFSNEDQSYIPLTRDEFAKCTSARECGATSPKQTRNFDCIASAFRNSTKKAEDCDHVYFPRNKDFIHTIGNLTVYYFHKPTDSTLKCYDKDSKGNSTVKERTVVRNGRGILHTNAGCTWVLDSQNIGPGPSEYRADSEENADTLAYDPHGFLDITANRPVADYPKTILGLRPWNDPIGSFTDTIWKNPIQFATGSVTPLMTAGALAVLITVLCCVCSRRAKHYTFNQNVVKKGKYDTVDGEDKDILPKGEPSSMDFPKLRPVTPPTPPPPPEAFIQVTQLTEHNNTAVTMRRDVAPPRSSTFEPSTLHLMENSSHKSQPPDRASKQTNITQLQEQADLANKRVETAITMQLMGLKDCPEHPDNSCQIIPDGAFRKPSAPGQPGSHTKH